MAAETYLEYVLDLLMKPTSLESETWVERVVLALQMEELKEKADLSSSGRLLRLVVKPNNYYWPCTPCNMKLGAICLIV